MGKGQRKNESKEGRKGGTGMRVGRMKEVHVIVLGLINQGLTSPEASANSGHKLLIQTLDVAERYLLKLYHLSSRNTLLKIMKMPACEKFNKSCDKDHMWQSQVEIEHYSVAYLDRITAFEAL